MPKTVTTFNFAQAVVDWQLKQGRHDLPWQNTQDPYAVWLSEIMLQQTQVSTVRTYFARFMQRFPTVVDLAAATQDDVLGLWSGLGYYSRARNLHKAAQEVVALHGGEFPRTAEQLTSLPGIGRSTAAAVASLCFGEPVAILDGNVKRVLTRFLGFKADLASSKNERELWQIAQSMLPSSDWARTMPRYTQGVMDLGATLCTPKQPRCADCPLASACVAKAENAQLQYPVKTKKLKRSAESWWLLYARTPQGDVLLHQRAQSGVWAGLFALPMFESFAQLQAAVPQTWLAQLQEGHAFKHVLTHKDMHLHPVWLMLKRPAVCDLGEWFAAKTWPQLGLPAPVRQLLTKD
jgi:A/G-specific adenine glycosylase